MELKRLIFAVAFYFGFCSGKGTVGSSLLTNKTKQEHQLNSVVDYGPGKASGHHYRYHYKPLLIPPVISKRDSYVEAANSIGGEEHAGYSVSYHVPQESTSGGYSEQHHHHHPPQLSPYGGGPVYSPSGHNSHSNDDLDHEQSSKGGGDLVGLLGLLGLVGLKGTVPLIKIATVTFIALLPVLVPLTLLKFGIILLKPVITFGRNLESPSSDLIVRGLLEIEKLMENDDEGRSRRDERSKCMERIACEGLFESLPRIFLRILGQNTLTVSGKKKVVGANGRSDKNKDKDNKSTETSRRKDLAELALNRLKNSQFLTRKPSTEDHDKESQTVCQQYKCPMLF